MPLKTAWLGEENLTDVTLQLFDVDNEPYGAAIINGINDTGNGWYEASVNYDPLTFVGYVSWTSASHPEAEAREYISPNMQEDGLRILTVVVTDAVTSRGISRAVVRASTSLATITSRTDTAGVTRLALTEDNYVVSVIKEDYAYQSSNIDIDEDSSLTFQLYPVTADIDKTRAAEQIWRDCQLPIDTFSFMTEEDAIDWVANTILPEAEAYVNAKLNSCVMPYTYPLEASTVLVAYKGQTYTYVSQQILSWDTSRKTIVRFMALYRIFLLADSLKKEYLAKAEAFRRVAEDMLNTLCFSLQGIVTQVTSGGRKFGLLHLKLPKQRKNRNEYSTWM